MTKTWQPYGNTDVTVAEDVPFFRWTSAGNQRPVALRLQCTFIFNHVTNILFYNFKQKFSSITQYVCNCKYLFLNSHIINREWRQWNIVYQTHDWKNTELMHARYKARRSDPGSLAKVSPAATAYYYDLNSSFYCIYAWSCNDQNSPLSCPSSY